MMRKITFLFFVCTSFVVAGCFSPPEFDVKPTISLLGYEIYAISEFEDSVVINIEFEDGDGDLGLRGDENFPPYHPYTAFQHPDGGLIKFGDSDTLPDYTCFFYETILNEDDSAGNTVDTIYVQRNPNRFNYTVDILEQKFGEEDFELFVFGDPFGCLSPFYARFGPLNTEGFENERPLKGELQIRVPNASIRLLFRNSNIKFRIRIKDRALNSSNIIETEAFNPLDIAIQ